MKTFTAEMKARGWWMKHGSQTPATHLLLDGGRLCVPDDHAGTFLNVYFNAILRAESVSVVELKTPIFKLFFDIDARVDSPECDFSKVFRCMYEAVHEFWVLERAAKMIICSAPPKNDKIGFHVIFPAILVNAPIALAFRDVVVQKLKDECQGICHNTWEDAIDPCVFKANGLRVIYSHKGPNEERAYTPAALIEDEHAAIEHIPHESLSSQDRREFVHACSLRTFGATLTPCAGGQDTIADQPHVHKAGGVVIGRSVPLDVYAEMLPKVQAVLPPEYAQQRFVGMFKTEHAVMLRSSSRYCQNVKREHRTSTVYFCVTRRGVCQKCYCRKDDHGCAEYSSQHYPLETAVLDAFVPTASQCKIIPETLLQMPSKKKTKSNTLDGLLKRSRFSHVAAKRKKKKS
jgi:hypothetical protein